MAKKEYAGGFSAITSSFSHLKHERALITGSKALLKLNKHHGIDCPGCAWPDPKEPSVTEFCENGAKAIAAETTTKKITPDFFKKYNNSELYNKTDYWLEQQGRLTTPMYKPKGSDNYIEIEWDDAFKHIQDK